MWCNGQFTNLPVEAAFHIITISTLISHKVQMAISHEASKFYIRTMSTPGTGIATWHDWHKLTLTKV
jgi:hypothetical protein